MVSEFISPDDKRWGRILERAPHDFYHLPEYISFAANHEGGRPCAFLAQKGEQALLVPLLIRSLPEKLDPDPAFCDALTPYGYPGPILSGEPSEGTVAEMLQQFLSAARDRGIISIFWRLHPLLNFPNKLLENIGMLVRHGSTVYIDLSNSAEQIWTETSNNHRRHIRQLEKKGFVVVRNEWRYWSSYLEIYRDSMKRVEAGNFYFFSDSYFKELRDVLGDRLDLWTALSPENEVAAASLWVTEDGIVEYHLGATAREFTGVSPLKLIISEVRNWAREAGNRLLHLGGGVGGSSDSLYTFKSRFSPLSAEFHTFRSVLLPKTYEDLTAKRFGAGSLPRDGLDDFFPAYRTP